MSNTTSSELLAILRKNHHDKHALCDRLEEIADALPDNLDKNICQNVAQSIEPILQKAHRYEEETLYPALASFHHDNDDLGAIFERLKSEHHEDLCFGEEVRDVLHAYAQGDPIQTADATGYMLRGFFENLRRHMAFEEELVRPLRRKIKAAPDFGSDAAE